jgi:hypothetical protein
MDAVESLACFCASLAGVAACREQPAQSIRKMTSQRIVNS